MIEFSAVVTAALVGYAVLLVLGAVLLVTTLGVVLLGERRVRVARRESIPAHYFHLARSH